MSKYGMKTHGFELFLNKIRFVKCCVILYFAPFLLLTLNKIQKGKLVESFNWKLLKCQNKGFFCGTYSKDTESPII